MKLLLTITIALFSHMAIADDIYNLKNVGNYHPDCNKGRLSKDGNHYSEKKIEPKGFLMAQCKGSILTTVAVCEIGDSIKDIVLEIMADLGKPSETDSSGMWWFNNKGSTIFYNKSCVMWIRKLQ